MEAVVFYNFFKWYPKCCNIYGVLHSSKNNWTVSLLDNYTETSLTRSSNSSQFSSVTKLFKMRWTTIPFYILSMYKWSVINHCRRTLKNKGWKMFIALNCKMQIM
jgi:hypothetical protein